MLFDRWVYLPYDYEVSLRYILTYKVFNLKNYVVRARKHTALVYFPIVKVHDAWS